MRSAIRIDLGALRRNARRLIEELQGAELWAVVKADAYGHGARDIAGAALEAGASVLCVFTVREAVALRDPFRDARILAMGPVEEQELPAARDAGLEIAVGQGTIPEGVPVHLKLDTGMGRLGYRELPEPTENVVGLMTQLATADNDSVFAERQLEVFREAAERYPRLSRHAANSAAALRIPEARFDAARCGVALYGLSPFGTDPAEDGLEPVLSWRSRLAQVKRLQPGESTGYGRRFVAERDTWIGLVPVGYADGFRRDFSGTQVLVAGERCRSVGAVSMDSFAVVLPRELPVGETVTIIGDGILAEEHARHVGTINYEITSRIESNPERAEREAVGARDG
jgi:alanine racemase